MASYRIRFSDRARAEDLPKIDTSVRMNIAAAIDEKLGTAPETFGKPLRHTMRLLRVLRVGDWRVVFRIEGSTVLVGAIRHRRDGYNGLERRFI